MFEPPIEKLRSEATNFHTHGLCVTEKWLSVGIYSIKIFITT